jgi:hypothetical protein
MLAYGLYKPCTTSLFFAFDQKNEIYGKRSVVQKLSRGAGHCKDRSLVVGDASSVQVPIAT